MISSPGNPDLLKAIQKAIAEETERIIEAEIEEAKKRIDAKVRERVGVMVAKVASYFDYTGWHDRLTITVNLPPQEKGQKS